MKIVYLAPFGVRPKGTVLARMVPLAVELQKMGHKVVIVAPPYTNADDAGKTEIINGVTIRNITLWPYHKVLSVPLLAWRLFREIVREQPDMVHLFKPKGYGGVTGMFLLLFKKLGIHQPPLVLDMDDWEGTGGMNELHDYSTLEKRFYGFQEQWLCRKASGVTVASLALQQIVLKTGRCKESIFYLPNCVGETERKDGRHVRQLLGIAPATPVVLLYTRYFEFNQEQLHQLFFEIYKQVPGVKFLIVGSGRNGEDKLLLAAAHRNGFSDALVMAGWVEPTELPEYLAAGDVAVYPLSDTLVNRCKCPAKLTELLANGVAVVADRVGQAGEYINPANAGMLCDPEKRSEMADAAIKLLKLPELRMELAESNRRYVQTHFNWRLYAAGLQNFYEEHVAQ